MTPDNVTLIVKAPNQQIDDQNIQCQSSWTVRQLKGHLSEVYPSKPSTEEQKIIYSGQLLDDNTVLKDVLRTYECQLAHTMHLVCSPKRMAEPQKTNPEIEKEGLRRRNVEGAPPAPEANPEPGNMTCRRVDITCYVIKFKERRQELLTQRNATANAQGPLAGAVGAAGAARPEAPPAAATPPAPPEELDEARAPRDWLDHLYAASRVAILLSLVYLYGSPARLLLVLLLVAAGYLHQIGFFRDLQVNPANNENQRRNDNQPRNEEQPNANQPQPEPTANANPVDHVDDNRSLLAVTWMVFSSFFASLIPDTN
ncbi:hypothetical protein K1T71_012753 [Dendrolimus kikuchii]|uniref:Uncharacterized protein n=1 Tax=Dendrolimus kikuchii TaxID=765133 RepID=A0ACC1CK75_9NEOP|nr:hypothetical protein K1T71_012753 [Dendrolimus kikuchii]